MNLADVTTLAASSIGLGIVAGLMVGAVQRLIESFGE